MTDLSGILWEKGKWKVQISFQGRRYYLGRFNKIEDAIEMKKKQQKKQRIVISLNGIKKHILEDQKI